MQWENTISNSIFLNLSRLRSSGGKHYPTDEADKGTVPHHDSVHYNRLIRTDRIKFFTDNNSVLNVFC